MRRPRRVAAETLGLMALGQLQQSAQAAGTLVEARCQIAPFGKPARHRTNREVGGVASGHLVPAQGSGYARLRQRAHRVGGGHRAILGVLVVVQEHPFALLLPPLAGRPAGRAPLHLAGHRQRRPAHFAESPLAVQPDVDVQAARAGGLGPAGQLMLVEHLAHDLGQLRTPFATARRGPGSRSMRSSSG